MIVVLTMMYMPRGIGGYLDRRRAMRRFVTLRGPGVPQGSISSAIETSATGTDNRAA